MDDGLIDLEKFIYLLDSGFLQKEDLAKSNMGLHGLDSCQEYKIDTIKYGITLLGQVR